MGAVFNRVTLSATGDTLLAVAGTNAGDAGWQLTFAGSSWTGSIVLKQNTAPPGATASLSTVSYFNATTGALVAAGTAITSDGSFIVANTGLDLYLSYTHTAGTVQVTASAGSGQYGGVQVAAADVTAGTFGAYTGATGTYAFPGAVTMAGALFGVTTLAASGVVTLTNATEATTGPAGALVLTGGLYVAKKVFSIGDLTVGASTFVVTAATGAVVATGAIRGAGAFSTHLARSIGIERLAATEVGRIRVWGSTDAVQGILEVRLTSSAGALDDVYLTVSATQSTFAGPLAITGALTGVTTAAISGNVTGNTNKWGILGANGAFGIGGLPTATSILNITGLPVAAAGLATGDVWSNSGVLTIV